MPSAPRVSFTVVLDSVDWFEKIVEQALEATVSD